MKEKKEKRMKEKEKGNQERGEIPFLSFFHHFHTYCYIVYFVSIYRLHTVIPFTDPLCGSFPSRNIGFIFPIKIHHRTRIVSLFLFSRARFRERGNPVGIGVEKNSNSLRQPRITLIKTRRGVLHSPDYTNRFFPRDA